MGEYSYYIWTAYGITLVVLAINLFFSFYENRKIKKIIRSHLSK